MGLGARLCAAHAVAHAIPSPGGGASGATARAASGSPSAPSRLVGPARDYGSAPLAGPLPGPLAGPLPGPLAGPLATPLAAPLAAPRSARGGTPERRASALPAAARTSAARELGDALGMLWVAAAALTTLLGAPRGDFDPLDLVVAPLRLLLVFPLAALVPVVLIAAALRWRRQRELPSPRVAIATAAAWLAFVGYALVAGAPLPARALVAAPVLYVLGAAALVALRRAA